MTRPERGGFDDIKSTSLNHVSEPVTGIEVVSESVDPQRGIMLRYVRVPAVSEFSDTLETMQADIARWDKELRENPDWTAPVDQADDTLVVANPVSEWVYASPAMREWRQALVPTAEALIPMQRPHLTHLPTRLIRDIEGNINEVRGGGEVDDAARSFYTDALDSIGIRSRARIMTEIAGHHIDPERETTWISLASGAAVPVFEALQTIAPRTHKTHLRLIDYDQNTLDFATQLGVDEGLTPGVDFTTARHNLITDMIVTDELVRREGEASAMMVDALGIFEYFNDKRSTQFLRNAYRLVKPGGALVIANMLSSRPELAFNQRGIGWPKIYPRSLEGIAGIAAAADMPLDKMTVTVPEDGVYAVVEIKK
jgi:SAM-dependent methyltransferase